MRQFFGIRKWHTVGLLRFLNCILFSGAAVLAASANSNEGAAQAKNPETPSAVIDLLHVLPFTLIEGYRNSWSKERSTVRSGVVVVLEVNPALVVPRAVATPVLYAGNGPVQRLNDGHESGRVIGIISGEVDLSRSPIWFGRFDLPKRITARMTRSELSRARKAGIKPFTEEKVQSVRQEPVEAADLSSLLRGHVAALVLEYSPQEAYLAEMWRLPTARARPPKQ